MRTLDKTDAANAVAEALKRVAPDAELEGLDRTESLREEFELDSLDFESFVVQLSERSGVRIDEDDYPQLQSFDDCVTFLVGSR